MPCKVFPKLNETQLGQLQSSAEAKFYRACRDHLPSSFLVLHSLSLVYQKGRDKGHAVGENDFLICNPNAGILVVEVKGGGIRYDPSMGSQWFSIDRNGLEHEIKDPFEQSKKYQFRIMDLVKEKVRGLRSSHFSIGHSVAFPDISNNDLGKIVAHNRPREIILCGDDLEDLSSWYDSAVHFWSGKEKIEPIGAQGLREIERVFLKPVYAKPSISVKLRDEELERIKLTDEQARLLLCLESHTRVNITGGAGTGKTVLAKRLAETFSMKGKSTALVCYNRALGQEIKNSLTSSENLKADTYHAFFRGLLGASFEKYFLEAKDAYPKADEWKVVMPFAFLLALEDRDDLRFDAVIVDEGQDFSQEMWMSLEALLIDDAAKMFIFSDTNQGLYSKMDNVPELSPPFLLQSNCRNTKQIHNRAYQEYEGPPIAPPSIEGAVIVDYPDKSVSAQLKQIADLLTELISEGGVDKGDIVILIANSANHEACLEQLKGMASKFKFIDHEHYLDGHIRVSTIKRFKGLEATVLILWGLGDVPEHARRELHYVGVSRAKSLCFVVN